MKKVLKGWLIDNSVTTDNKTDKILLLASAGSLTLDDVLEEMYKQDTGLRPETMRHSVTLYHRIVMDLILNGYSVNTGLFRAVPQLKGVVEGGVWNKENNSIYVSLHARQGSARGDRPDRGGDPRREVEHHVHPGDRGSVRRA